MHEENNYPPYVSGVNLQELFLVLWNRKLLIFSISMAFSLLAILYSLQLPNIYKSEALLAPADQDKSSSSFLGRYSGMAGLAGLTIPSASGDKTIEAVEIIKSHDFFANYFLPLISLQDLMAVKSWEKIPNKINYDPKLFDSESGKWIRKTSFPLSKKPSSQEAFEVYKTLMNISKDKKTSFITLSIKHHSPYIAQEWVQIIIKEINRSMRTKEKELVSNSIIFLNQQANKVNYEEVKQAILSLQQEQVKSLMLIEANEDYIFKILNSPLAPEIKSEPSRSQIVISITLISFIFISFLILFIHYFRINISTKS
ncbi:Wzz/FepE/Etk N-terminal domain-containing protein [Gammaproteobacteria bacterium]|nr:Wzz/FepE/Etk N-terminal domain-containing protein [Gammaproteobacteria bacterium]